ncbi:MAG: leucine--tRNA ligase [Candidatus Dojkabacteria bacterium]
MKYDPKTFENKWKEKWLNDKLYKANFEDTKSDKFYSLYSYPYPSGAGLHVGHSEGMVANDIMARYWRMKGRNVIYPMGWDSFGLPAENYAIKTGVPPQKTTDDAVVTFKEQINNLGISIDWDTEVGAHWPEYYKWTQWIFVQLFKKGLAYKKKASVNWCPKDQTVLANEQVINGKCERCDTEVVQKDLEQWFFKITDYADRLDKDLDKVDWPDSTKATQRNWIGKKTGINIDYKIENTNKILTCFTTRPDTNFGVTFIAVAPDSQFVKDNIQIFPNKEESQKYIDETSKKTELERLQEGKKKTGAFTGLYAINNLNNKKIPVYLSDFVLANFGTGALVGVPGHDLRDFQFAKTMGIEIIRVVKGADGDESEITEESQVQEEQGAMINSDFLNGMNIHEATKKIMDYIEEKGWGKKVVNFRIRDWLVSRQRYWGCPIPIVYDPEGNPHAVEESDLPILLPTDVDFRPTGESPIARSEEYKKRAEEKYGKGWHYEADTMDTFVDSSWYFFRHIDANDSEKAFDSAKADYWLPTDLYMIGAEHIVLHLLYSRFFTKFFFDEGIVNFNEPFYKMRHMGIISGPDGRKMSKRWGNVINPNDEIAKYSADTVRMYEMFMGPLADPKPWNDRSENGVFRFLNKVWDLSNKISSTEGGGTPRLPSGMDDPKLLDQLRLVHKLIQKISEDTEILSFNTAIAKYMEFINAISAFEKIDKTVWETFLKVLAPYAPFITEELWGKLGNGYSIHTQKWPEFDPELIKDEVITMAVQINGKVRGTIQINPEAEERDAMDKAKADEKINKYITSDVRKVIYIKGKILNIII